MFKIVRWKLLDNVLNFFLLMFVYCLKMNAVKRLNVLCDIHVHIVLTCYKILCVTEETGDA